MEKKVNAAFCTFLIMCLFYISIYVIIIAFFSIYYYFVIMTPFLLKFQLLMTVHGPFLFIDLFNHLQNIDDFIYNFCLLSVQLYNLPNFFWIHFKSHLSNQKLVNFFVLNNFKNVRITFEVYTQKIFYILVLARLCPSIQMVGF